MDYEKDDRDMPDEPETTGVKAEVTISPCVYGVSKGFFCSPKTNLGGNSYRMDYERCIACLLSNIFERLKWKR